MGLSNEELAEEAGINPWELRDDLAEGNPAEIITLAQQFHTASGQATDAADIAATADEITAAGYQVDNTPIHDIQTHLNQTRTQLGNNGDTMARIARDLATIADELATRTTTANTEITTLDSNLEQIRAAAGQLARDAYMNPINLSRNYNQEAKALRDDAVSKVRNTGNTIRDLVGEYEKILNSRLKALTDMDYDVPTQLDFDGRPPPQDIFSRYQVSTDPDGMVTYPGGVAGLIAEKLGYEPKQLTAGEARLLDDIGWAGVKDANDIQEFAWNRARSAFGGVGFTDGHADAFRHTYWNALLTQRFGEDWTGDFTTAHERQPGNNPYAEAMDLHNNEVGRRIAREHPDAGPDELARLIEQAVRNGETVVIDRDGNLAYSDHIPVGHTGEPRKDIAAPPGVDPKSPNTHWSGGYNPGSGADDDNTTSGDYPR